jgi:hypothetical protein
MVRNNAVNWIDYLGLERLTLKYSILKEGESGLLERIVNNDVIIIRKPTDLTRDLANRIKKYSPDGKDPCDCIENLTLWMHGTLGSVEFNGVMIGSDYQSKMDDYLKLWAKFDGTKPNISKPAWDFFADLVMVTEALKTLGERMCENSTVTLLGCNLGGTCDADGNNVSGEEEAEEFREWFNEDFFPNSTINPLVPGYLTPARNDHGYKILPPGK